MTRERLWPLALFLILVLPLSWYQFLIRGSSAASCDGQSGWRRPEDANNSAPAYFGLSQECNRWWTWQAANAYGTGTISPGRISKLTSRRTGWWRS